MPAKFESRDRFEETIVSRSNNDGFGEHVNVFIIFGQFLVILQSVLDTLHIEKSSKNLPILHKKNC